MTSMPFTISPSGTCGWANSHGPVRDVSAIVIAALASSLALSPSATTLTLSRAPRTRHLCSPRCSENLTRENALGREPPLGSRDVNDLTLAVDAHFVMGIAHSADFLRKPRNAERLLLAFGSGFYR